MRKILRKIVIVICVIVLLFVTYQLGTYFLEFHKQDQEDLALITEIKKLDESTTDEVNETEEISEFIPNKNTYGILHNINSDYIGWIRWNNGMISTPLFQDTAGDEKYMHHNIYGTYVIGGSAFIDPTTSIDDSNIPIYGHSVFLSNTRTTGQMFSNLHRLENQNYIDASEANRTLQIYWETDIANYEIVSVSEVNDATTTWPYYQTNFVDEADYSEWIEKAKSSSMIQSYVDTKYGDRYITFQTCKYREGDERIVVVAKECSRAAYE